MVTSENIVSILPVTLQLGLDRRGLPLSCTVGGGEVAPRALGQHDFLLSCA